MEPLPLNEVEAGERRQSRSVGAHCEQRAEAMSAKSVKPRLLPVSLVTLYAIVASVGLGAGEGAHSAYALESAAAVPDHAPGYRDPRAQAGLRSAT
jgi:hypothetical protein